MWQPPPEAIKAFAEQVNRIILARVHEFLRNERRLVRQRLDYTVKGDNENRSV